VSAAHAYEADIRLYDRLFAAAQPGAATGNYLDDLNPDSVKTIRAQLEPDLKNAVPEAVFQFERHGYFVADRVESVAGAPVFNRAVTLRDSSAKPVK
jgi:glutaminyl-tRNA synthetase